MKIVLVITQEINQIVLTPETKEEKAIFKIFGTEKQIQVFRGGYTLEKCIGGWLREYDDRDSVILCVDKKERKENEDTEISG